MRMRFFAFLFLLIVGCSNVTETTTPAVIPSQSVATPTQSVSVPATPTTRPSPTPAIIPTITPTPLPTDTPSPTKLPEYVTLEQVVTGLNNRDYEGLATIATEPFFFGIYGVEIVTSTLDAGIIYHVSSHYLADVYQERDLAVSADPFAFLPPRIDLTGLNPTDNLTQAMFVSEGWGDDQTGQAILYFTELDGELRWQGVVVSFDNFATVPTYPAGELSAEQQAVLTAERQRQQRLEQLNEQFPCEPEGLPCPFFSSVNPSGTLAVGQYGQPLEDGTTLIRYNFETETQQSIALPATGNSDFPVWQARSISTNWLDDERVLFGYIADFNDEGPVGGHPALLNVSMGEATSIDADSMMFWQSKASVTSDQAMLFISDTKPQLWRDGTVTELDTEGFIFTGVISADGSQIVLVKKVETDANASGGIAWISHDPQTAQETHLLTTDGTVGSGFGDLTLNATGSWVAIDVVSDLPEELGVWVISADGTQKIHLGIGTSNPRWLDDNTLIFTAKVSGEAQTQVFNTTTNERFRIELPQAEAPE